MEKEVGWLWMFRAIVDSAKKAWRGEEKLWVVFWLWGVLLYPMSIVFGLFGVFILKIIRKDENLFALMLSKLISGIFAISGITMIFVYPIVFCVSIWKCSKNNSLQPIPIDILSKIFLLAFCVMHLYYSFLVYVGTCGYVNIAFEKIIDVESCNFLYKNRY